MINRHQPSLSLSIPKNPGPFWYLFCQSGTIKRTSQLEMLLVYPPPAIQKATVIAICSLSCHKKATGLLVITKIRTLDTCDPNIIARRQKIFYGQLSYIITVTYIPFPLYILPNVLQFGAESNVGTCPRSIIHRMAGWVNWVHLQFGFFVKSSGHRTIRLDLSDLKPRVFFPEILKSMKKNSSKR